MKTALFKKNMNGCVNVRKTRNKKKRRRTCSETLKDELKKMKTGRSRNNTHCVKTCFIENVQGLNSAVSMNDQCKFSKILISENKKSTIITTDNLLASFRSNHNFPKKQSVCGHLDLKERSRKRKKNSQSLLNHKKERKDLELNYSECLSTDLHLRLDEKQNVKGQHNIPTSASESSFGDKILFDTVEDSCLSGSSEISESRRPKDKWLSEERDCSPAFNNLFNESGLITLNTSLTDLSSDSSIESSVKSIDLPDWMYVALDCEMVGVGPKGKQSVLARCSIVDYSGNVLYDNYIRPVEKITDYRTPWSGIRPSHMIHAIPIHQALPRIRHFLKSRIIIGHAVYNDFNVLGMKPEHYMVRDTAQCLKLVHLAQLEGRGNSLKKLTQVLLNRHIQVKGRGHCSVEDAKATLDLFKLVRKQWEHELLNKWMKKDTDISKKLSELLRSSQNSCNNNNLEDFLHDKFWPTDLPN